MINTNAAKAKPNPYRPINIGSTVRNAARTSPVGRKPNSSAATRSMIMLVTKVVSRLVKVRPTNSSGRETGASQFDSDLISFLREYPIPQKTAVTKLLKAVPIRMNDI